MSLIGRTQEQKQIQQVLASDRAELGIIYGRRRVGKSALLRECLRKHNDFYFEAIQGIPKQQQINHFLEQFSKQTHSIPFRANNWQEAFQAITQTFIKGGHFVVFDEFPWMASERNELVAILKYYWDNHWKQNIGLKLVLCGSIAQFMVKHLVHSKPLHNRKTFEMKINPLPPYEAKGFFKEKRSKIEVAQFLMIFGGIPKYLEQLDPSQSLSINVDQLCFSKNGFFYNEFETLFKEQFRSTRMYENIVSLLSRGVHSKEEISRLLHFSSGGGLTNYLKSLEEADFIKLFPSIQIRNRTASRTRKYKLWDEWLMFYFRYMLIHKRTIELKRSTHSLFDALTKQSRSVYFGIQFETLCFKSISKILDQLEIPSSELVDIGPYFRQGTRKSTASIGVQIDLIIQRQGGVWTIVECKFTQSPVGVSVIDEIKQKIRALSLPKNITLEYVLISASGVTRDVVAEKFFHHIFGLEVVL